MEDRSRRPRDPYRYVAQEATTLSLVGEINNDFGETLALVVVPQCAYVLPDDSYAPASHAIVWCRECDNFSAGESFPDLRSLHRWIADASTTPISDTVMFITSGDKTARQKIIDDARKQIEWLSLRNDRPKCFECGSMDIMRLPDDRSNFPHPHSGESILVSHVFGSTSIDTILYLLDIDGNRIGEIENSIYADN